MKKGDFTRWMYRGGRPNWIARAMNRMGAAVASMGVTSNIMVTLETTGRNVWADDLSANGGCRRRYAEVAGVDAWRECELG